MEHNIMDNYEKLPNDVELKRVICYFCKTEIDREEAIEQGWLPSIYDGKRETADPVCPDCCIRFTQRDADGEWEFKPDYLHRN
jgi:hypothetical protein